MLRAVYWPAALAVAIPLGVAAASVSVAQEPAPFSLEVGGEVDEDRQGALRLLSARATFILADIRTAASSEDAVQNLTSALESLCNEQVVDATERRKQMDRYWAKAAIQRVQSKAAWKAALSRHLSEAEQEALQETKAARQSAIDGALLRLTTATIAVELRLRGPQVDELRPKVERWLAKRRPTRSQKLAGDLMDEILGVPRISEWMLSGQRATVARMRSAKKSEVPDPGVPGDDMKLGRGRYPEDDFTFETHALAMFHGWDPDGLTKLDTAGAMLSRELRRGGHRPARFGDVALFKSLTDPRSIPLWNAVVRHHMKSTPADEETDPGPLWSSQDDVLIDARTDVVLGYLAERIVLRGDQRDAVREAVRTFVAREYTARTRAFGALDADAIWRELRLVEGKDPRRGSTSRKRLCTAFDEILDNHQREELGL